MPWRIGSPSWGSAAPRAGAALWLTAGITAGWWSDWMGTTGALRTGFDLRACYWFTGAFNVSLEDFGFFDDAPGFGPISLLLGTRLH